MLYNKDKKAVVKRSYDYLHTNEHINDNAKKRRNKERALLSGRPKK